MKEFQNQILEPGQIGDLRTTVLSKGELFLGNYFLIKEYESEEPQDKAFLARQMWTVEATRPQYDVEGILKNPLQPGHMATTQIRFYKEILLTSALFARSQLVQMFYSTAYQSSWIVFPASV